MSDDKGREGKNEGPAGLSLHDKGANDSRYRDLLSGLPVAPALACPL